MLGWSSSGAGRNTAAAAAALIALAVAHLAYCRTSFPAEGGVGEVEGDRARVRSAGAASSIGGREMSQRSSRSGRCSRSAIAPAQVQRRRQSACAGGPGALALGSRRRGCRVSVRRRLARKVADPRRPPAASRPRAKGMPLGAAPRSAREGRRANNSSRRRGPFRSDSRAGCRPGRVQHDHRRFRRARHRRAAADRLDPAVPLAIQIRHGLRGARDKAMRPPFAPDGSGGTKGQTWRSPPNCARPREVSGLAVRGGAQML
jgi:hypothetical protein